MLIRKTLGMLLLLGSSAAMADIGAGVIVGSQGYGVDLGYHVFGPLDLRLGYAGFEYKRSFSEDGVDYDGKLKVSGIRALADVRLGLGFRLSGGLVFQDNKVDLTGKPSNNTYNINGTTYQASDVASLSGHAKFGSGVAPYLGIGYGNVSGTGIGFYADLGAMYQGKAKTSVSVTCGAALTAPQCAQLRSDVAAEQAQVEHSMNRYKWYPVANIGVTIGF